MNLIGRISTLSLLLAALAACGSPASGGGGDDDPERCITNDDCALGERCFQGECVARDGNNAPNNSVNNAPNNSANNSANNNPGAVCGNGRCEGGEDAASCPADCATEDPCGGVSARGRCVGSDRVEFCRIPTGDATPELLTYSCLESERCDESSGEARCLLVASCRESTTRCVDAQTLQRCVGGEWSDTTCPGGCLSSALGGACAPDGPTRSLRMSATAEIRTPRQDLTDWGEVQTIPAAWMLALSFQGEELLDAVRLDDDGAFEILVPSTPGPEDAVVLAALELDEEGEVAMMLVEPGWDASSEPRPLGEEPNPNLWAWAWSSADLSDGVTLPITLDTGSGAAFAYVYLSAAYQSAKALFPDRKPDPLVAWLGLGTGWECGACFVRYPSQVLDVSVQTHIWLAGGSDEGYWSGPVTAHEFGHYVMDVFGYSPREGGVHYIGVPTHPGQAWSEGWATFFSTWLRADTTYYDKQGGGMFWVDLAGRTYSGGTPWQRPSGSTGLYGLIDENEVAAMTWRLSQQGQGAEPMAALHSQRMTQPPFARGYLRRSWSPWDPSSYSEHESAPMFADLLDALLCEGLLSTTQIDAVTEPASFYPYPSGAPQCF